MSNPVLASIERRRSAVLARNDFYRALPKKLEIDDLAWLTSAYHLSQGFIGALRVRAARFPGSWFFAEHLEDEKDHPEQLRAWILAQGLPDPARGLPTRETEAFIGLHYRAAASLDEPLALVAINGASEAAAQDFFTRTFEALRAAGRRDLAFWEAHTIADVEHSDIAPHLPEMSEAQTRAALHHVDAMFDALDRMLESWA